MSLRAEKKKATSALIRSVARELFLARGYDAVAVEDIAAAAGVSRASLFNYYRGKPAILAALGAELEPRLLQLVSHYLAKPLNSRERLQQLFTYSARILEQTGQLIRVLFVQGSAGAGFPALQAAFATLVKAGKEQGDIRLDVAAEPLAEMIYLGFMAGLLGWCRHPEQSLEEEMLARAAALATFLGAG